ncbi:MAG TPA: protein kinase [Candidatus Krumholzibacteria bacterium]|nr:protein kinase [Candidatus Krumholzibacteria bacterium]
MNLSPGTKLGPYEILSPLGAGGMGEVYRAKDTRLGRDVAIKVLPQHLSSNPEVRARFEREAQTVSSLNHPHICTLFDVGREGDTDYLVMELIDGETLADRLAKGPLPTEQVLAIGGQVADALSRAHRAGIVHRDLKPGNIMLTKSGAKLMDFGLARATGLAGAPGSGVSALTQSPTVAAPLTAEGTIVGTFQYMSPEQLEGKEADARGDIWALGCVLYEMASGRRPFEGKSQASLIVAIMDKPAAPLTEVAPASPPALNRLIQNCLAKNPDDRVQTAHDVRLQLDGIRPDGTSATAAPVPARARARVRPGPWLAATLAIAVIVGVAAFTLGRRGAPASEMPVGGFAQKTYRVQSIFTARFMPDGKTLVASSALEGNRVELFVIRPEYPEPQPLGKPDMLLLAISSRGELAILNNARYTGHHRLFAGTLARMPLEGAAPRELMEDVREADWDPSGESLVIVHDLGGTDRIEYPAGTVLHEASGYLSDVRFSPRGDLIAFMEHPSRFDDRGSVKVVDRNGHVRELTGGYWGLEGIAWAPDGNAIYFGGGKAGDLYTVFRVDLAGNARMVSDNAGAMTIHDIAKDGTWAVTRDDIANRMLFRRAGSDTEVDLSWLDSALDPLLSGDGRTIAFTDLSPDAGTYYGVATRPTTGGPIVHIGEGAATGFSADEKSILALIPSIPPKVVSYPLGAGQPVQLDRGQFENISDVRWLPHSTNVLVSGNLADQPARVFLLDPATHDATAVGPEGIWDCRPGPDGQSFVARSRSGWAVYSLQDADAVTPIASLSPADNVIRWSPDGSAVFAFHRSEIPAPVDRVDLATGKRTTILLLNEEESAGRVCVLNISLADDLRSVAYAVRDYESVLFTVTSRVEQSR